MGKSCFYGRFKFDTIPTCFQIVRPRCGTSRRKRRLSRVFGLGMTGEVGDGFQAGSRKLIG